MGNVISLGIATPMFIAFVVGLWAVNRALELRDRRLARARTVTPGEQRRLELLARIDVERSTHPEIGARRSAA